MSIAMAFVTMDTNLGRVGVALRNFMARSVKIMVGTKIAWVCVANLIPPMLAPNVTEMPKDAWVPSEMEKMPGWKQT